MSLLFLTVVVYLLAEVLYRRLKHPLANPVALAVLALVVFLRLTGVPYAEFRAANAPLIWLLKPAVVALGYALYRGWGAIKERAGPFFLGVGLGSAVSLVLTPLLARALGAPEPLVRALAFKSVTSGITVELAPRYGADPALAVPLVILAGVLGAALGVPFLRALGVRRPFFLGAALGTASHGIGTARAAEEGPEAFAAAALAMALAGLASGLFAPLLLPLIGLG